MKHVTEFSAGIPVDSPIKELRLLPHREWLEDIEGITSILIMPQTKKYGLHDSGYRCMDFAACHYETAHCLLSGCSDVINLGGIGGFNNPNWLQDHETFAGNWSIDCLPNNGLLRIFAHKEIRVGVAISSFEIYHLQTTAAHKP